MKIKNIELTHYLENLFLIFTMFFLPFITTYYIVMNGITFTNLYWLISSVFISMVYFEIHWYLAYRSMYFLSATLYVLLYSIISIIRYFI